MKIRLGIIFKVSVIVILTASISLTLGCGQNFSSNGQRIYFTAENASGKLIAYSGGPSSMMQGRLACVNCHGTKGHGGTVNFMMQSFEIPNITWSELTAQDSDHPPFTDATVKRAITQGLDEVGEGLKYPMPRWRMSDSDLTDLVDFIKTLK
jgi:cytochrome c oxidase subunit 2